MADCRLQIAHRAPYTARTPHSARIFSPEGALAHPKKRGTNGKIVRIWVSGCCPRGAQKQASGRCSAEGRRSGLKAGRMRLARGGSRFFFLHFFSLPQCNLISGSIFQFPVSSFHFSGGEER